MFGRLRNMPKTRRKVSTRSSRSKTAKTRNHLSNPANTSVTAELEENASSAPDAVELSDAARILLASVSKDCESMQLSREFRNLCSQHANPVYARSISQYMRNQFSFFGLKAAQRRKLQKEFTSKHSEKLSHRTFLLQFAASLWQQDERECQQYGVDLMSDFKKTILGDSREHFDDAIACAELLITTKSWWDTVDLLASQMVGYVVRQRKEWGIKVMEQWIIHPHLWLRRTALLHQLNYKEDTDQAILFKFCLTVCQEDDFFIRKAIGWALRQYARTDSTTVKIFLERNSESLSKLSIREASKHL